MISTFRSYNRNIKFSMIASAFMAISTGLLFSGVYSVFVITIGRDYASLGFVTTFGGIIMILSLLPSGFLVDKFNRSVLLRIGLIFVVTGYFLIVTSNTIFDLFIAQLFDLYDYSILFFITTFIYAIGTVPLLILRKHVKNDPKNLAICPSCGIKISEPARFCENCGMNL